MRGSAGVHSPSGVVGPVRDTWVLGVAGGEIPWIGTVKLMVGGPDSYGTRDVPTGSFVALFSLIALVIFTPQGMEFMFRRWLNKALNGTVSLRKPTLTKHRNPNAAVLRPRTANLR